MPNAVPGQQGLIGFYNNAHSPGVYVSWDSNTTFSSTQSVVFKGPESSNYRFPLIVDTYGTNTPLGPPIALGAGATYVYCLNANRLIAYKKVGDSFTTYASSALTVFDATYTPNRLKVATVDGTEMVFLGYHQGYYTGAYLSSGSFVSASGIAYSSICGVTTTNFLNYDISFNDNKIFLGYGSNVYQGSLTLGTGNTSILGSGSTGVIISYQNGLDYNVSLMSNFCGRKISLVDDQYNLYEYMYLGDIGIGASYTQWNQVFKLAPTTQQWSALTYDHFGLIVAMDQANNNLSLITAANVTVTTDYYTQMYGLVYQVTSTTSVTNQTGIIASTIGSIGIGYQQFNSPTCITEDPSFNFVIGDLNNRLTYIPTNVTFVESVAAPINEIVDVTGNPADYYFIKQTNCDFTQMSTLAPVFAEELLIRSSVLYELNALLKVPVYDEEPLFRFNRSSATLAYGDIVTDPAPQIRITSSTNNGQRSPMYLISPFSGVSNTLDQSTDDPFNQPSSSSANYPNGLYYRFTNEGTIFFLDQNGNPVSLQEYDTVLVSYYVKLFTNTQINNALYLALQAINAQPGLNKIQKVAACPFYYDQTLVSGATFYLLRQLLVGLNQRERRLLVQDPESGSFDAVAGLRETAKMYQDEFNELLKKLPIAKLPTMGTITTPEYSMPGGRSRLFRTAFKDGAS